jgi:imidazolonepropionase-like amidohydrolase
MKMLRPLRTVARRSIELCALLNCCSAWCQTPSVIAFVHVNVVDVRSGEIRRDSCVVVEGSHILSVGKDCGAMPLSHRVINGRSKYLIPGLWDMHVHTEGDEAVLQSMLAVGITGVRDMGGDLRKLTQAREAIESGKVEGPTLLFAGPMLEGSPAETDENTWVVHDAAEADRDVSQLARAHVDFIKVHDHLSRQAYFAIAAAAKTHGLPFAGHVTEWISPIEASDAGQASIEHFEFLPKHCVSLLGAVTQPAECQSPAIGGILTRLAKNGTYIDPTLQSFQYFAPANWSQIIAGFKPIAQQIRAAQSRILAGTDWGTYLQNRGAVPGWCLHDELAILVRVGFTNLEALQAATLNPAVYLRIDNKNGTVEAGKNADLILLRANPLADITNTQAIAGVLKSGRFIAGPSKNPSSRVTRTVNQLIVTRANCDKVDSSGRTFSRKLDSLWFPQTQRNMEVGEPPAKSQFRQVQRSCRKPRFSGRTESQPTSRLADTNAVSMSALAISQHVRFLGGFHRSANHGFPGVGGAWLSGGLVRVVSLSSVKTAGPGLPPSVHRSLSDSQ